MLPNKRMILRALASERLVQFATLTIHIAVASTHCLSHGNWLHVAMTHGRVSRRIVMGEVGL